MGKLSNVEIVSDGTARGTEVLVDGKSMRCIKELEIDPIVPGGEVTARLVLSCVNLRMSVKDADIGSDGDLSPDQIREALFKK